VKVKTVNGEVQLHALVDGKKIIINESTVRRDIHLEDTEDEAVYKELGDSLVRAATTASSLETECQETIGDTIAQTGFESVSKHSNDSLFARCNTLRSDKDRLKLNELMELCTNLQQRVLDFEKTKTTQANEIDSLKRRVKKLEKKDRDEENLGEDASKQGMRINAIDADEDIILVNVQDDAGRFDVNTLTGDEVFAEQEVAAKDVNLTIDEVTLAQALTTLKSVKPKVRILQKSQENGQNRTNTNTGTDRVHKSREFLAKVDNDFKQRSKELSNAEKATLFQQILEKRRKHFAAKKDGLTSFQEVNTFVDFRTDLVEGSSKRAGAELEQESTKNQKVDEDKDTAELQSLMEFIPDEEEVAIDVVPLATKSLKILWNDLKTMFKPHVEDAIWRNQQGYKVLEWKLYDSCGVHSLMMQSMQIYMLVEKRYPLTPPTITDMLNKKLQGRIVRIKSLLNAASITAAHIRVNAAQLC
ncbi:hypothetical protein Tco_0675993, partial [Tanacetum coccineum]